MLSSGTQIWSWQTVDCFASNLALPEVRYNTRCWLLNLKLCLLLLIQAPRKITVHSYETASSSWLHATRASYSKEGLMMAWITLGWQLPPPSLGWLSGKVKPGGITFSMISQRPSVAMKRWGWGAILWTAGGWCAVVRCFHQLLQIKEQISQCLLMIHPITSVNPGSAPVASLVFGGWTINV